MEEEEIGEVPVQPTSSRRTFKRTKTSLVWQAYEIIMVIKGGKEIPKANVNIVVRFILPYQLGGTGHLIRHMRKCEPKHIVGTQGEHGSGT